MAERKPEELMADQSYNPKNLVRKICPNREALVSSLPGIIQSLENMGAVVGTARGNRAERAPFIDAALAMPEAYLGLMIEYKLPEDKIAQVKDLMRNFKTNYLNFVPRKATFDDSATGKS